MKRQVLIRIEASAAAAGYTAQMFDVSEAGPVKPALANGPFEAPPGLLALKNVLPGNTPASAIDEKGFELYRALHAALGKPLQDVLAGPAAVLHFDLGDDPNLLALPWEIQVWPEAAMGVQLTRVRATHDISRVWKMAWDAPQVFSDGPLRLLIAIGDATGIAAQEELTEIRRRVQPNERAVDIIRVEPLASKNDLYNAIKTFRPHVLHFIGHGDSERLKFDGWDWKIVELGDVGGNALQQWKPRLVFLNACRSAVGGASVSLGDLAPLCAVFLAKGAQAVIAMQGDIRGVAAGVLAGAFYEKLAAGSPIHEALSVSRGTIEAQFDEKQASYPALMLRCSSRAALPCFGILSRDYRERTKLCDILPKLRVFVNQVKPRRQIYASLWPYQEEQLREPFILLLGGFSQGKTVLAGALLDLAARLDHRVRYVDVGLDPPVNHITVLERIWGGPPNGPPRSPLLDPLPLNPEDVWAKKFEAANRGRDVGIYKHFCQALAGMSADRPLTIVLDNFRINNISAGVFWYLWEKVFLRVGRDLKNVNLVLVLDRDNYRHYEIDERLALHSHFRTHKLVELDPVKSADFPLLLKEYMYFRSDELKSILSDPDMDRNMDRSIQVSMIKEKQPLSVANFEKKTRQLAEFLNITLPDLRQ
ncbi:CHAT domain-containing protein [Bradyrhizobium japonicum]|uniref:CHAT domain-containing protein n=1 Tax=Bradyrhizobium japonicum TaxID=375 RepID=UPI00209F60ED|nr:CHAT domain-containing protein [Bradyrhizobium japonicum]MCP1783883.1 hypothetical protein [Bradyrhizobium japonicum]MCP1963829.1 hypothetical protein [Bradyrhizobium japonicum]